MFCRFVDFVVGGGNFITRRTMRGDGGHNVDCSFALCKERNFFRATRKSNLEFIRSLLSQPCLDATSITMENVGRPSEVDFHNGRYVKFLSSYNSICCPNKKGCCASDCVLQQRLRPLPFHPPAFLNNGNKVVLILCWAVFGEAGSSNLP